MPSSASLLSGSPYSAQQEFRAGAIFTTGAGTDLYAATLQAMEGIVPVGVASGRIFQRPSAAWGTGGRYGEAQAEVGLNETALAGERAGLTSQGAWAAGTTYQPYDSVTDGANTYYALAVTTGQQPSANPAVWVIVPASNTAVTDLGAWAAGTTYAQFARVTRNGRYYYSARAANTGNDPAMSPSWWSPLVPGSLNYRRTADGAIGMGGVLHLAHGIRAPQDATGAWTASQALWVAPLFDSAGIVVDSPPLYGVPGALTTNALLIRDLRGASAYDLLKVGWDGMLTARKGITAVGRVVGDNTLTITKLTGQTGLLQRWMDSNGTDYFGWFDAAGGFALYDDTNNATRVSFTGAAAGSVGFQASIISLAGVVPLLVRGASAHTTNIFQVQRGTGTDVWRVSRGGYALSKMTAAPTATDMNADGEWTGWVDEANNQIKFVARIGGVLKTAAVAVA
jgi:hypothetical protein